MGMYPGATLCFGIAVPEELDWEELPWYVAAREAAEREAGASGGKDDFWSDGYWEDPEYMAEEILKSAGLSGVSFVWSGHLGYGDTTRILCSKSMRFYAYDVVEVRADELTISQSETEKLEKAWNLLFGSETHDDPVWLLSLSYG